MKYSLFLLILISLPTSLYAVTAQGLYNEFNSTLKNCKKIGFYKCQEESFEGDMRGIFHVPIEKQKLKLTQEKYEDFLEDHFNEGLNISFFKKTVDIKYNLDDNFDISVFSANDMNGDIQPLNKEGTLFKFSFKNAPPVVLVIRDSKYKIGILPDQEKEFRKTKEYQSIVMYRLKNNILRYHMKEAELLKYDKTTLQRKVSEAQAPVYTWLEGGNVPDFVKKMNNKSVNEISKFYLPLNTESQIIGRIKELNKL